MGEEFDYMECNLGRRLFMELSVHCENVEQVFVRSNLHFDLIVYCNIFRTNVAENCYVSVLVSCFLLEGFVERSV